MQLPLQAAILAAMCGVALGATKPNILFILADDLGWNDVEVHGSPQIQTGNINSICQRGTRLNRYYAQPVCSPTRSTLMSGRHVIHTGVYSPFGQGTANRLNVTFKLLPEYMKEAGYDTHMVGKWHLGQNTLSSLPTGRGFDTYLGYWSGAEDYLSHVTTGAYDFANGTVTAFEYAGAYSTYTFTDTAVGILKQYDATSPKPFFMYLAYQNVHWPLEAPQAYLDMFADVPNTQRQAVCALCKVMDDAIGQVTTTLDKQGLTENTILIFASDNGGPTNENEGTWSSNYPLRGGKNSMWEGGTRVAGCIAGPGLKVGEWDGFMHVSDWMPTLLEAVGATPPTGLVSGDGQSVWQGLSTLGNSSRDWILYEAHPDNTTVHGNAFMSKGMKIVQTGATNPSNEFGWVPPPGQDPKVTPYTVSCPTPPETPADCSHHYCLFDVVNDPCEHNDISGQKPEVVQELLQKLMPFKNAAVPPTPSVGCDPIINSKGAWRPCDSP
eukprot:TRINITY_DN2545_c0_g1_i7.p1 TRINITY_DN2545_c0_g1~~TRINITY_DN2545_c0_g1_i7.p1  ORF type:complete len:503 (+),score=120.75 TRINITY_DN2545_c0_g1_i7:27-1511(+)